MARAQYGVSVGIEGDDVEVAMRVDHGQPVRARRGAVRISDSGGKARAPMVALVADQ
jgi:hypothetical protein